MKQFPEKYGKVVIREYRIHWQGYPADDDSWQSMIMHNQAAVEEYETFFERATLWGL